MKIRRLNEEQINELKMEIDRLCDINELFGKRVLGYEGFGEQTRRELANFMMYLSLVDGQISSEESELISKICGGSFSPGELSTYIRDNNIFSEDFVCAVPKSVKVAVEIDNELLGENEDIVLSKELSDMYKCVGTALVISDENVNHKEEFDLEFYTKTIEGYIKEYYFGA